MMIMHKHSVQKQKLRPKPHKLVNQTIYIDRRNLSGHNYKNRKKDMESDVQKFFTFK